MQKYTEIPASTTLADSLPLILQNDKTVISCHSGTSFPIVQIWEGMLCYRTDEKKLYQLHDPTATGVNMWHCIADLSGDARLLDGGAGNTINYDKKDLNSWKDMPTGFYQGSNMLHAPSGDTMWRVIQIRQGDSDGYASQLAFSVNTDRMMFRKQLGGVWSNWLYLWTGEAKKVVTNLNADMVDGKEPGNASGNIPLNNKTLNVNLNADLVDGYNVGNDASQVPVSNTTVCASLNADMVDGHHAGNEANNVALSNGTKCTNLNADMVDGYHVDGIVAASVPPGTLASFAGRSVPSGWLLCNGAVVSRTTYANLFKAIGVTYGTGNGSTTFGLPNYDGRVIQGTTDTNKVGVKLEAGLPDIGNHYHGWGYNNSNNGGNFVATADDAGFPWYGATGYRGWNGSGHGGGFNGSGRIGVNMVTMGALAGAQRVQAPAIQALVIIKV